MLSIYFLIAFFTSLFFIIKLKLYLTPKEWFNYLEKEKNEGTQIDVSDLQRMLTNEAIYCLVVILIILAGILFPISIPKIIYSYYFEDDEN